MYSEGVQHFRDGASPAGETSPGLFGQTHHSLHRQGDTSRDQIACSQFDTPSQAKLQIYKTLIHPDPFSLSSNSLSSSSLFSTFNLFISFTIINIYFFFFYRLIFHPFIVFFPLLFLLTPLSSVLSSLPSSKISIFINKISFSYSFCL